MEINDYTFSLSGIPKILPLRFLGGKKFETENFENGSSVSSRIGSFSDFQELRLIGFRYQTHVSTKLASFGNDFGKTLVI
jgi:hypothetical protein